jgi:hypothetical protein
MPLRSIAMKPSHKAAPPNALRGVARIHIWRASACAGKECPERERQA